LAEKVIYIGQAMYENIFGIYWGKISYSDLTVSRTWDTH